MLTTKREMKKLKHNEKSVLKFALLKKRELSEKCKEAEKRERTKVFCGEFDLQQIFHLPITRKSAVLYKIRNVVFNLTMYDIESDRKIEAQDRGASEINTAVYKSVMEKENLGCTRADIFADGRGGQNENSITSAMHLYTVVHSENINEIWRNFIDVFAKFQTLYYTEV